MNSSAMLTFSIMLNVSKGFMLTVKLQYQNSIHEQ